jgi:hypothetical protein
MRANLQSEIAELFKVHRSTMCRLVSVRRRPRASITFLQLTYFINGVSTLCTALDYSTLRHYLSNQGDSRLNSTKEAR